MRKKLFKNLVCLAMFFLIILPALTVAALPVQAQTPADPWGGFETEIGDEIGLGEEDPRVIVSRVINIALGFLGIIAVVIIILGGFKWMTAGGNEDKTAEAKKLITAGIIGLVIILAAWGIAKFVVNQLYTATQ